MSCEIRIASHVWTKLGVRPPGPKITFQRTDALRTETNRRPVRSVHECRPIHTRDPNDRKAPNDLEDRNDPDDLEDMNDLKARRRPILPGTGLI